MRLAPGSFAILLVTAGLSGCCQRFCCNQPMSPCAPTTTQGAAVVRYGDVCQVPAGGNTVISGDPNRRVVISDAPAPRVVVSEPNKPSGSKGWRKAEPESMATTRVEGGLSTDSLSR